MIKVLKNFISNKEIKILNSWCMYNYTKNFFKDAEMDIFYERTRLTTRGSGLSNSNINYPQQAYDIQKKLIKKLNIKNPLYPPPFYNGIVNGIGFEHGSIYEHYDPIYFSNTYTLHCNFITQKPVGGGLTIIDNMRYETNERDLLLYIVSHKKHRVTEILGNIPRILWCYGFCLTENEMNHIFKS